MEAHKFLNKKKEKIISLKIDFGHGGSPDDLKSWKKTFNNGGGAIFDPGIHLIDLISYFDGGHKIKFINKLEWRGFWNFGAEEESSLLLKTDKIPIINLNISLCKWLNYFAININTTNHNYY